MQSVARRSTWCSCWTRQEVLTRSTATRGISRCNLLLKLFVSSTSVAIRLTSVLYATATTPTLFFVSSSTGFIACCLWHLSIKSRTAEQTVCQLQSTKQFNHFTTYDRPTFIMCVWYFCILLQNIAYYLHEGGCYVIKPVCPSFSLRSASRKNLPYAWIYMKLLPKVGLGPILRWFHFWGDLDWPSMSFRGHSRPARSFRL